MASPPLVTHIYTADPSAHVFNGTLYIYPSHDRETDIAFNDNGDQYDMTDYHVLSLASPPPRTPTTTTTTTTTTTPTAFPQATDHGVALTASQVPWASKQLWAPDAATRDGKYFLYFPARDAAGVFRIGVAVSDGSPTGPFEPRPSPIEGSYSIDPAAFVDPDGDGAAAAAAYLYFGGLWGGQLQCWDAAGGGFDRTKEGGRQEPRGEGVRALGPRVGVLRGDMLEFEGAPREVRVVDAETGEPLMADDHDRRFFEAPWVHKYSGTYYLSYSTGDTHFLVYATGKSPLGPFTFRGRILEPVLGWTTHHSIVEWDGRWWLFYHDCELSGGVDHLRCVKMREIFYDAEGRIRLEPPR